MSTIEDSTIEDSVIRDGVIRVLVAEGKLAEGTTTVDENLTINAGQFRIDSLSFIRVFITLEDEFDVEFGDEALMQHQFSTFGEVIDYVITEIRKQEP